MQSVSEFAELDERINLTRRKADLSSKARARRLRIALARTQEHATCT